MKKRLQAFSFTTFDEHTIKNSALKMGDCRMITENHTRKVFVKDGIKEKSFRMMKWGLEC